MPKIPLPTKLKDELPQRTNIEPANIEPSELKEKEPEVTPSLKENPPVTPELDTEPEQSELLEATPEVSPPKEDFPSDLIKENCVKIGGEYIEIKPTKVKYFRNRTAASYNWLKLVPLTEFLTYQKGTLDPKRDADQILYDFLVAVFDNSEFVRDNYDEMSADDVEQIVKIFGRINHIDEKEEAARKNREAQAAKH